MQADGTQVTGCRISVQRLDCDADKLGQFRIGAEGKARKCTFIKALRHAAEHMHAATVHIPDVQNPFSCIEATVGPSVGSQCGITLKAQCCRRDAALSTVGGATHQRSMLTLLRVTVMVCAGHHCSTRKLTVYGIFSLAQQADIKFSGIKQCSSHKHIHEVIA